MVMFMAQLLFGSLYSVFRTFQSYSALRKGAGTAKQSLMQKPAGVSALRSLYISIRDLQIPVVAVSLAAALAPLLTIVVSGLYHTQLLEPRPTQVSLPQTGVWNVLNHGWYTILQRRLPKDVSTSL